MLILLLRPFCVCCCAIPICIVWGVTAVGSFPFIVIADSDLGVSAMERVRDAGTMFLLSCGIVIVSFRLVPTAFLRIAILLALAAYLTSYSFESPATSQQARWPIIALIGMLLVIELVEARSMNDRPLTVWQVAGLVLLFPSLLILTDRQARIYWGQVPVSQEPRSISLEQVRTSVSLMEREFGAIAVSPAAKLRAIGKDDGSLVIENMEGALVCRLPPSGEDRSIGAVSFSPDGKFLAGADNDRRYRGSLISIWDVRLAQPPRFVHRYTLAGHTHSTFSLDFFPDGKTLVSASGDHTIRFWDMETGKEYLQFNAVHSSGRGWDLAVDCVATAPDNRTFATWAFDGLVKIWEKDSLQLLGTFETRGSTPCAMAFSADGSSLICTDREKTLSFSMQPNPIGLLLLALCTTVTLGWIFWAIGSGLWSL